MNKYANQVKAGKSFIVLKQSKALFKLSPVDDNEDWEEVLNFNEIKKEGVDIDKLLESL